MGSKFPPLTGVTPKQTANVKLTVKLTNSSKTGGGKYLPVKTDVAKRDTTPLLLSPPKMLYPLQIYAQSKTEWNQD